MLWNADEAYFMKIDPEKIEISSEEYAGFFYATRTLRQLVPAGKNFGSVPSCEIFDAPCFVWRGFMLDSCRNFQDPEWIKKLIDLLSLQKINVLHWHLSDDQAWRIEIKKFPELTLKGAWRNEIGFGLDPEASKHFNENGEYGGFYSQEKVREIIAYAAERNITIVPEIEIPGHASAALAVYPKFGCTGGPYKIQTKGGVFNDVYCAGNEDFYKFGEDVFDEISSLFPSKIIHVGGDECPKVRWKNCPKCQAKIREQNLKNEAELLSFVIEHFAKFLEKKGKRLIGWDEILESGKLPKNSLVMSWRGVTGGINAAKAGHDVVMTPTQFCYFDYSQSMSGEPRSIGGFVPLDRVYQFDPAKGLPEEFEKHVLGAQANLWTEYIPNEKHAEYMIAPRISALAEISWTPRERLNWSDFSERLKAQYKRFEAADWNFRRPEQILIREENGKITFVPAAAGARIFFTFDGSEPTENSEKYEGGEVEMPKNCAGTILVKARIISDDGRLWAVNRREFNLPKATVISSMASCENLVKENVFDGMRDSIYWNGAAPKIDDFVAVIFSEKQRVTSILCLTGKNENGGGGDRLHDGILEISSDGKTWKEAAKFVRGKATWNSENLENGEEILGARLRVLGNQNEWLVVREFEFGFVK